MLEEQFILVKTEDEFYPALTSVYSKESIHQSIYKLKNVQAFTQNKCWVCTSQIQ